MTRRLLAVAAVLVLAGCAAQHSPGRPLHAPTGGPPSYSPDPSLSASPTPAPSPTPTRQHVTGAFPPAGSCHLHKAADGADLPDPVCTPGATDPAVTQANIAATICVRGYTATVRPPLSDTAPAKHKLMAAYSVTGVNELDHLVPLELGGSSDVRNLWAEPGTLPNAKDGVEAALHALVCQTGRHLPLTDAQHLIAADWTTAEAQAQGHLTRN